MSLIPPELEILELQTDRMILEPITEAHAQELLELFSDERLHTFVPFVIPTPQQQQERCARWAKRISREGDEIYLNWAARHRESKKIIGHFQSGYKSLSTASIGYVLAKDFQGRGLAFEALKEILRFLGGTLKIEEVRAWSDTRNVASHRLAARLGMKQVEFIKDADFFKGATSDEYVFSINLNEEPTSTRMISVRGGEISASSIGKDHPDSKRAPGLDLLRALAVIMVIVFHFSNEAKGAVFAGFGRHGWMGVDLFFVLSGYLIGAQMFRPIALGERLRLGPFFVRRFLRTLPNFVAILLIYFCFTSLRERPELPPLWKYLTFTQNIGLDRHSTGAFSHAWSLCVEEQFYILLPLLSLFAIPRMSERRLIAVFLVLFTTGIILRASIWHWVVEPLRHDAQGQFGSTYDKFIYYPTYTRLDGLLVGVALALIKVFRPQAWRWLLENGLYAVPIAVALLVTAAMLNKFSIAGAALTYSLIAMGFGCRLIASLSPRLIISRLRIPGVSTLALLSYGIYLIQKLVFHSTKGLLPEFGIQPYTYFGFLVSMAICVFLSFILYLAVERPFLKIRERLAFHFS